MKKVVRGIGNILRDSRVRTLLSLFFLFIGTVILALMNLGYTVALILTLILKPTFKIGEIKFVEWGKISGKSIELIYEKEKVVVAPSVYIEYDIKAPLRDWLKKIVVENPEVLISRNGSEVNIVEAFATGGSSKSGTGVPIGRIEVKDGNLKFRDISYEIPIEKKLENVQGYVSFDKVEGIDLLFFGEDGDEKASYSFNNLIEDYEMNIALENMRIDTILLQYGYYYEPVQYREGRADLDLTISPRGLEGYAKLKDALIEYVDFLQPAEKVNGEVKFLGEKIEIDADFQIFEQKRKFTLDLEFDKKMEIKIELGKLTLPQLNKYTLLKDIPMDKIPMEVENLTVSLNLDEENKFSVGVDYKLSDGDFGLLKLKNPYGGLTYSEDGIKFNFLQAQVDFNGVEKKIGATGTLENDEMEIEYLIGDFKGEVNLEFLDEDLKFLSREGFTKGEGTYNYESKILNIIGQEREEDSGKESLARYNFKDGNLELFQGEWLLNLLDILTLRVEGVGEENELYFEEIEILQNDKIVLSGDGELDLKKLYYRLNYESENFEYSIPLEEKNIKVNLNSIGQLTGEGTDFRFDSEGTVEKIEYDSYVVNGLRYSLKIDPEEIQILNVSNNILTLSGNYNIMESKLSLEYGIENLDNSYLKMENISFNIIRGEGTVLKDESGIVANFNIADSQFYPLGDVPLNISGEIRYGNGEIRWRDLVLNQNSKISGEYNISSTKYRLEADVFETNLSQYFNDRNFKYRLIGRISVQGEGNTVDANANFTLDDIYYKGERVGKFKGEVNYGGEKIDKGKLKIENLEFMRYREPVVSLSGEVDFGNEIMNLSIDEEKISIRDFHKESPFEGLFSLKSNITGSFTKPEFSLTVSSDKILIDNFDFKDIDIQMKGDLDRVQIENLSFHYLENRMDISGFYGVKDSSYLVNLDSKEINLNFLNLLTRESGVKDISGEAVIDLTLSNSTNSGMLKGEKISFNLDQSRIRGKEIDFLISLDGKKIEVKNFVGKINDGDGEIKGYFNIPPLKSAERDYDFFEKLDYDISLNLKEVNYSLEDKVEIKINSKLNLSENKISGNIDLIEGEIRGIPGIGDGLSIVGILKKIILTAIPVRFGERVSVDSEYEREISSSKEMGIDLDFRILKEIKLDIPDIWNILEEIQGNVTGSGKLSGQLNKLNFLGQIELGKGEFILGENEFKILTGRLVFNDPDEYIPNINPILTFEAKSPFENTEISLIGELRSLNFRIKNSQESSTGSLASLFNSQEGYSEENNRVGPSVTIIRGLLGAQLTNSFLSPTARTLKRLFGLSKLRITADITDSLTSLDSGSGAKDQATINFGIKIVAEDSIYKDKIFAVADAKISGAKNQDDKGSRYSGYDNFDRYSTGLEYRYSEGQSLGIGVKNDGQNSSGIENQKIKRGNLNYYIDFKIEKKYDSLMEIYTGIIKTVFPRNRTD